MGGAKEGGLAALQDLVGVLRARQQAADSL